MKKGQPQKTRYFKKDYAPARAMAARKKSRTTSGKVSTSLKKASANASKTIKKVTQSISSRTKTKASKSTTSRKSSASRKSPRIKLAWPEATLLSIIGTCTVAIIFSFVFTSIADPVKRSERELNKLANAYYVEYLYPRAVGGKFDQAEAILKDFSTQGLPNVRLRQLLLFNEAKFANSSEAFSNPYYECDTNKTYVRYYPVAPYGPRDYTVQYGTSCEKIGLAE